MRVTAGTRSPRDSYTVAPITVIGNEEPATVYQLTPPIDFRTALELLETDHLIVDPERTLVIFLNGVLTLEVSEGDLEAAERVTIEALDAPQSAIGATLVERFLE